MDTVIRNLDARVRFALLSIDIHSTHHRMEHCADTDFFVLYDELGTKLMDLASNEVNSDIDLVEPLGILSVPELAHYYDIALAHRAPSAYEFEYGFDDFEGYDA